ncbi:SCO family protein [Euzebya sp.]|uniref:SCO family protein n=1 Tax=Euzebya sp. TaxID=1971409 RepID=UPI003512A8C9
MTAPRLLAACALVLVLAACTPSSTTAQLPQPIDTAGTGLARQALAEPVPRPHTDLVGTDGEPFDLAEATAGKPALVFMGYTSCPDICPVHMAAIARALDETGLRAGRDLDVVFISVDPDRDSPEVLRTFLDAFDPGFTGATGSREALDALADDLGLPQAVLEGDPDSGEYYTVGHPGQVLAFGPDGPAEFQYPFGVRTSHWIADLPDLVEGTLT